MFFVVFSEFMAKENNDLFWSFVNKIAATDARKFDKGLLYVLHYYKSIYDLLNLYNNK